MYFSLERVWKRNLFTFSLRKVCLIAGYCRHETRIRRHIGRVWKRSWPGDKTTGCGVRRAERKTACLKTSLFSVAASISGRGFLIGWLKWFKSLCSSYSPPRRFVTWLRPIPRSSKYGVSWRQHLPPASRLLRHGHSFIHLISYCY